MDFATTKINKQYLSTKNIGYTQSDGGGLLHLIILKAELARNTEYFGDMDPYVQVQYNYEIQKTPVLNDAGRTPEFNITLAPFIINSMDDDIKFTVFDKDLTKSEVIGSVTIKVGLLCSLQPKKRWLTLMYQSKEAGDLLIDSKYSPSQEP